MSDDRNGAPGGPAIGSTIGRLTRLHTLNTARTQGQPRPRLKPRGLPPALEPHGVWAVTNPADAALYGQDLLGSHRVHVEPAAAHRFTATFHGVLIRDVTLGYLDYATDVTVEVRRLPDDYLVIVPANGTSTITIGGTGGSGVAASVAASPVMAAIPAPGEPMTLTCDADAAHLVVRIERAALDLHLSRLLGHNLERGPIAFAPAFDLSAPAASRWNFAVQMIHAELFDPGSLLHRGVGLGQLEEFVMSSLLYTQPSNYLRMLTDSRSPERRVVRAACEFIERNLSRALNVADIAEATGLSVRSLQAQFRDDLGVTPTAYVRNRRLERARADLADAAPGGGVTVTDVAARWGFSHFGRFASTYRARFGETPSHTLRS